MKNIKTFKQHNESTLGDIQRLDPRRRDSDQKGINLFNDIEKDYIENNKDLRKVSILDGGGSKISLNSIEIGKDYSLSYVFGKYHPVKRSNHSGNKLKNELKHFEIDGYRGSLERVSDGWKDKSEKYYLIEFTK